MFVHHLNDRFNDFLMEINSLSDVINVFHFLMFLWRGGYPLRYLFCYNFVFVMTDVIVV